MILQKASGTQWGGRESVQLGWCFARVVYMHISQPLCRWYIIMDSFFLQESMGSESICPGFSQLGNAGTKIQIQVFLFLRVVFFNYTTMLLPLDIISISLVVFETDNKLDLQNFFQPPAAV